MTGVTGTGSLTRLGAGGDDADDMKRGRVVAGQRIGALEAEVLERLWEAGAPVPVREVLSRLKGRRRAYTTVMTVLTRLQRKGLVERVLSGRSYLYRPTGTRAEIAARAIHELVAASEDPRAVLAHFVEGLAESPELLKVLDRLRKERGR